LNKLGVRRESGVDSLKAADLSSLLNVGPRSEGDLSARRRLPDNHFAALLEKTYAAERGRGRTVSRPGQPTPQTVEPEQVNRAVLASLPLYWKQ
jgi:hypothetical protein